MAKSGVELDLCLDHVRLTVEGATDEAVKELAYRITERTQANIRSQPFWDHTGWIDTGAAVNSVYPSWRFAGGGSEFQNARSGANSKRSGSVTEKAPLDRGISALVAIGVNYGIYGEVKYNFLWRAAQDSVSEFGGIATKVYKRRIHDRGCP